jgi:hypothetical protein
MDAPIPARTSLRWAETTAQNLLSAAMWGSLGITVLRDIPHGTAEGATLCFFLGGLPLLWALFRLYYIWHLHRRWNEEMQKLRGFGILGPIFVSDLWPQHKGYATQLFCSVYLFRVFLTLNFLRLLPF